MNIDERALRPVLSAYADHYATVFEDERPADDWRKRALQSYRDRVIDVVDGEGKLSPDDVRAILEPLLDPDLPTNKESLSVAVALDGPVTFPKWRTLLGTVDEYPSLSATVFTRMLREDGLAGVEVFMRRFDEEMFQSVGAELEMGAQYIGPSPRLGLVTTLLMALYPETYISYQYTPHRDFFGQYSDFSVQNAQHADLAKQYRRIVSGARGIQELLETELDTPDLIDVRNIIRHHEELSARAEPPAPPADTRSPPDGTASRADRANSDETESNEADAPSLEDIAEPSAGGHVELSELYEAFSLFVNALPETDPDNKYQEVYIERLEELRNAYGSKQNNDDIVDYTMDEYREVHGDGERLQPEEFGAVRVDTLSANSSSLDKRTVCPVAPESQDPLPTDVSPASDKDRIGRLLAEFPDDPATAPTETRNRGPAGLPRHLRRSATAALADLAELDPDKVEEPERLSSLLSDPNSRVRHDALRAVAVITATDHTATTELRPHVMTLATDDTDPETAAMALDVLSRISSRTTPPDEPLLDSDRWPDTDATHRGPGGSDLESMADWTRWFAQRYDAPESAVREDLNSLNEAGIDPGNAGGTIRYRYHETLEQPIDQLPQVDCVVTHHLLSAGYRSVADIAEAPPEQLFELDGLEGVPINYYELVEDATEMAMSGGGHRREDPDRAEDGRQGDPPESDIPVNETPANGSSGVNAGTGNDDLGDLSTGDDERSPAISREEAETAEQYELCRLLRKAVAAACEHGIGNDEAMATYRERLSQVLGALGEEQHESDLNINDYRATYGDEERVREFRIVPAAPPRESDQERYHGGELGPEELPHAVPQVPEESAPVPVVVTSTAEREQAERLLDRFLGD